MFFVEKNSRSHIENVIEFISKKESGVLVMLANYSKHDTVSDMSEDKIGIDSQSKSDDNLTMDWRKIGTGSQILRDLGVRKMKVIGQNINIMLYLGLV